VGTDSDACVHIKSPTMIDTGNSSKVLNAKESIDNEWKVVKIKTLQIQLSYQPVAENRITILVRKYVVAR